MSEEQQVELDPLFVELVINEEKFKTEGYVSLQDDQILTKFYVTNPEENPEIFMFKERVYISRKLLNWKIYGKDGDGREGKYGGSKTRDAAKNTTKRSWRKLPPGKRVKVSDIDLKKIMGMYDFEEEGIISVSYDGHIEYCTNVEEKDIKEIRIRSQPVEVLAKNK